MNITYNWHLLVELLKKHFLFIRCNKQLFKFLLLILTTRWVTLPPVGVCRCVWDGWRESLRTEVEST